MSHTVHTFFSKWANSSGHLQRVNSRGQFLFLGECLVNHSRRSLSKSVQLEAMYFEALLYVHNYSL